MALEMEVIDIISEDSLAVATEMSLEMEVIDTISHQSSPDFPLDGGWVFSSISSLSISSPRRSNNRQITRKSYINSNGDIIEHSDDWGLTHSGVATPTAYAGRENEQNRHKAEARLIEYEQKYPRAEKGLIDFAIYLVVLEMVGGGIRILAFIWATTVLLGGFSSELEKIDFWFVSVILFMEGTGIFNGIHQLDSRFFFRAVKAIKVGQNLTSLQLLSATTCIILSLIGIVTQYFGQVDKVIANRKAALMIFYVLALAQAVLFLAEKVYWHWRVSYHKLLEKVCDECGFSSSGVVSLRRFFHDTYWTCKKNGVFQALDMDLITFAKGLLLSDSQGDQLIAVRILVSFIHDSNYDVVTCQRIKNTRQMVERLLKMLSWQNPADRAIRIHSATIIAKLANEISLVGIPGAMQSISSLLKRNKNKKYHGITSDDLNLLGLKILKKLANNLDNCRQIIKASGLLSMIIEWTSHKKCSGDCRDVCIKITRRSLKVLNNLSTASGKTGKMLRQEISEIVFTVSNIRLAVMEYSADSDQILGLGVEILKNLSLEKSARNNIGNTGGVIDLLLRIFTDTEGNNYEHSLRVKTGETIVMLSMESKINCAKILKEPNVVNMLVDHLIKEGDVSYKIICTKLLRNLCEYSGTKFPELLEGVKRAFPSIIETINPADIKLVEASLGLSVQISKMVQDDYGQLLTETNFPYAYFKLHFFEILRLDRAEKYPAIRRYAIEQLVCILQSDINYINYFEANDPVNELEKVLETTSELESFKVIRGTEGFFKHKRSISSLVQEALGLLKRA